MQMARALQKKKKKKSFGFLVGGCQRKVTDGRSTGAERRSFSQVHDAKQHLHHSEERLRHGAGAASYHKNSQMSAITKAKVFTVLQSWSPNARERTRPQPTGSWPKTHVLSPHIQQQWLPDKSIFLMSFLTWIFSASDFRRRKKKKKPATMGNVGKICPSVNLQFVSHRRHHLTSSNLG